MSARKGAIYALMAASESGKTTLLLRLLEALAGQSLKINGVICPPLIENGVKTGIEVMNVTTRERHRLATVNNGQSGTISTTRWRFENQALEWGNEVLKQALPCDLFIVDELGPLEFERGLGFITGLTALDSRDFSIAFVTIRPVLLAKLLERWWDAQVIELNAGNRDQLLPELLHLVNQ